MRVWTKSLSGILRLLDQLGELSQKSLMAFLGPTWGWVGESMTWCFLLIPDTGRQMVPLLSSLTEASNSGVFSLKECSNNASVA